MDEIGYRMFISELLRFGLITEEQATESLDQAADEWRKAGEDAEWWWRMARIAWEQQTSWWRKFWDIVPDMDWMHTWIRERRGW